MPMTNRSFQPWFFVFASLVIVLAGAAAMVAWIPAQTGYQGIVNRMIVGERPMLVLQRQAWGRKTEDPPVRHWIEVYDLESLDRVTQFDLGVDARVIAVHPDGKALQCVETVSDPQRTDSYQWNLIDLATGNVIESKLSRASPPDSCRNLSGLLHGEVNEGRLSWIDFGEDQPRGRHIKLTQQAQGFQVGDTRRFFLLDKTGAASLVRLRLSGSSEEDASLETIATWETSDADRWVFGTLRYGGWPDADSLSGLRIASVSPDQSQFQLRSLTDGQLIKSVNIPSWIDSTRLPEFDIYGETLLAGRCGIHETYNVPTEQPLATPSQEHWLTSTSNNQDLVLWKNPDDQFEINNGVDGTPLASIPSMDADGYSFGIVSDQRTTIMSSRYGFTIAVYETRSGQLVGLIRPTFWGAWCLPMVTLGYFVWTLFFLRVSSKVRWTYRQWDISWIPISIVALIPVVILVWRTLHVSDPANVGRLTYHHLQGLATSGVSLALVWLVFGRAAWATRLACLGGTMATILLAMRWTFADSPEIAWYGLVAVCMPTGCVFLLWLALRWRGWRICQWDWWPDPAEDETTIGRRSRVTIGQALSLTALVAVLLAIGRPFWPSLEAVMSTPFHLEATLLFTFATMVMMFGALHPNPAWHVATSGLVVAVAAFAVTESTWLFVTGYSFLTRIHYEMFIARIFATYAVAFYASLLFYRWQGWRCRLIRFGK